ncbi:hypothetical protein D3C72_1634040 [compost metagenome]
MVDPSPSSDTNPANNVANTTAFRGSPLINLIKVLMIGSNSPVSNITPKYMMANITITAVGATLRSPSTIMSPISGPNPATNANTIGTMVSATMGDNRLVMISAMKVAIIENPRMESI